MVWSEGHSVDHVVRKRYGLILGIVHIDSPPVVGSVNPCSSLNMSHGVIVAEGLTGGEEGPVGVHHVKGLDQPGLLGLRVVLQSLLCVMQFMSPTIRPVSSLFKRSCGIFSEI